jgi:thiol-disulfide isomerase/thioredoxin
VHQTVFSPTRRRLLTASAAAGAIGFVPATPRAAPLTSVFGASQWLNTPPLQPEDLKGRVVLVNVWTFSCIYCIRTLPHLRAWAAKYKDQGLVVIGVQTPEFAFEKNLDNVRAALAFLGVDYPVAIDNEYRIWRAFDNDAWPTFYFIDTHGRIRYRVAGEGDYERSERMIQTLLSETDRARGSTDIVTISGRGIEAAPDIANVRSPETYVGYSQAANFVSPDGVTKDMPALYRSASVLSLNQWDLLGLWMIGGEFATLGQAPGSISYRFHARDLHLILTSSAPRHAIRFQVTLDGMPPGDNHGSDVDAMGLGIIKDARLYQLIRQTRPIVDRTFLIKFFDPGVQAYDFTFG